MAKNNSGYTPSLAREMYQFFAGYSDSTKAPSFLKFAMSRGITLERLSTFKRHKKFAMAWRECEQIRRDYLIDMALTKRFDPTFTKHLLSEGDEELDDGISVHITVEDS